VLDGLLSKDPAKRPTALQVRTCTCTCARCTGAWLCPSPPGSSIPAPPFHLHISPAPYSHTNQLLHHPWVAEEDERWKGLEVPQLELERMDDAPSLENWVQELVRALS